MPDGKNTVLSVASLHERCSAVVGGHESKCGILVGTTKTPVQGRFDEARGWSVPSKRSDELARLVYMKRAQEQHKDKESIETTREGHGNRMVETLALGYLEICSINAATCGSGDPSCVENC